MTRLARGFEKGVSATVHWSITHRKKVIGATWLVMLLVAPGMFQLQVHNRMTEWVDPDEPAPAAFLDATSRLDGLVNFERSLLVYTGSNPDGILSPESLREQEALIDRLARDVPEITGVFTPVRFVQLAHYESQKTLGENPAEARLPSDETELELAIASTKATMGEMLDYLTSADGRVSYLGINFAAEPFSLDASKVGGAISDSLDTAYADMNLQTLTGEDRAPVGVASISDHVTDILRFDMIVLGAAGIGLVFLLFWFSAGRTSAVLGGFSSLAIGLVITMGVLGWLGIPFNILNFAIMPLVMGNGIDYSIHVLHEAQKSDDFGKGLGRHLGKALGVPIVLVTLTTGLGLATLGLSDSPYLQQMGFLAAGSITLIAILSLTYLPAFLATFRGKPGKRVREFGRGVFPASDKMPGWLIALIVLPLSAGGVYAFATMDYEVDLLEGSLPKDDATIVAHNRFQEDFTTDDVWFLLFEGEVVSDESFAFQERFMERIVAAGITPHTNTTFNLPRVAEGHARQQQIPGSGLILGLLPTNPIPPPGDADSRVAAMEADAPYEHILRPLVSLDHRNGALYFFPNPSGLGVAETDELRKAIEAEVAAANPPSDLDVRVYSFKQMARDFMGESQESLQMLYVISLASTLVLFWAVTSDWKATLIVAAPVLVSSLWWFGLLKLTLGAVGVYQLISLVFITSIGSDYAAYLVYKVRATGDRRGALAGTGSAVLFSAATDAGAFFIFSLTAVRSGGQMLLGAALAIVAIFAATWLMVPAMLRWAGRRKSHV